MQNQQENNNWTDKNENQSENNTLSSQEQYDLIAVKMDLRIIALKQELADPEDNCTPEQKDKISKLLKNVIEDKQKMPEMKASYIEWVEASHKEARAELDKLLKQINGSTTPGWTRWKTETHIWMAQGFRTEKINSNSTTPGWTNWDAQTSMPVSSSWWAEF